MVDLEELLQPLVELQTNELGSSGLGALLGLGRGSPGTLREERDVKEGDRGGELLTPAVLFWWTLVQ